jgi:hypothetical protein
VCVSARFFFSFFACLLSSFEISFLAPSSHPFSIGSSSAAAAACLLLLMVLQVIHRPANRPDSVARKVSFSKALFSHFPGRCNQASIVIFYQPGCRVKKRLKNDAYSSSVGDFSGQV